MTTFPSLSSDKVIKALKKAGFQDAPRRGKGSHFALYKEDARGKHLVIIPKRKAIPTGTMRAILEQAGMSRDEFFKFL